MDFEDFKPPSLAGPEGEIPEAKPTEPPLPIFNARYTPVKSQNTFYPFARLPKEIRLDIWQLVLQRQRMISLTLEERADGKAAQRDQTDSDRPYQVTVTSRQFLSALFGVCHEARRAALDFYRVHIPCRCVTSGATPKESTLYFNPEHDILKITPKQPVRKTLVRFFHDLKAHDPKNIGLLNLAMSLNDLNAHDLHTLQPNDLTTAERDAFVGTLSQLREVFFTSMEGFGRIIAGPLTGLIDPNPFEFQRSVPIATRTSFFQRLRRDPRQIDLQRIYSGTSDPRNMVYRWQKLLRSWNITHAQPVTYRFMLTYTPFSENQIPTNLQSAERWIRKEHQEWIDVQNERRGYVKETMGRFPLEDEKDLEQAVRPAFGFWLFPIEGLGPVPKDGEDTSAFRPKRMLDLREHWPELVLMDMS